MISTRSRLRFKILYRGKALTRAAADLVPPAGENGRLRRHTDRETITSAVSPSMLHVGNYGLVPANGSMTVRSGNWTATGANR